MCLFFFNYLFSFIQTQTYEIILTLGQAFEVAYQMAIQSRARQYVPPSSLPSEVIETKSSRPVSQSWSSMRRSAVSTTLCDASNGHIRERARASCSLVKEDGRGRRAIVKVTDFLTRRRTPNGPPTKEDLLFVW